MAPAASAGFRRPPAPRRHNAGMNTLAERLGTRWPLIQAPMAGSQGSALALAVGAAGALGSLPGALLAVDGWKGFNRGVRVAAGMQGRAMTVRQQLSVERFV